MIFSKNQTISFIGDSLTDSGRDRNSDEGSFSYPNLGHGFVSNIFSYLHVNYYELNLRIINQGTSGYTSTDILNDLNKNKIKIGDHNFLMIGVNDAWRSLDSSFKKESITTLDMYKDNLEKIIEFFKDTSLTLISPFIIDLNKDELLRSQIDKFNKVIIDLSFKYDLAYIDVQTPLDSYLTKNHLYKLSVDRIHLNPIGHTIITNEIVKKLNI